MKRTISTYDEPPSKRQKGSNADPANKTAAKAEYAQQVVVKPQAMKFHPYTFPVWRWYKRGQRAPPNYLAKLPSDCLKEIAKYMSKETLFKFMTTCKTFMQKLDDCFEEEVVRLGFMPAEIQQRFVLGNDMLEGRAKYSYSYHIARTWGPFEELYYYYNIRMAKNNYQLYIGVRWLEMHGKSWRNRWLVLQIINLLNSLDQTATYIGANITIENSMISLVMKNYESVISKNLRLEQLALIRMGIRLGLNTKFIVE